MGKASVIARALLWAALAGIGSAAAQPQSSPDSDKRVALVIGNGGYRHVARIETAGADAALIADTLRRLSFELVGGGPQLDLDKAQIERAVRGFGEALRGGAVGLFYYAGHGVQVRGVNYLVPVAANPAKETDADFDLVDANLVLRQMEGSGTLLNLVILDANRGNPFPWRGGREAAAGLAQMRAPDGTLISFADQPGAVAPESRGGNGPFAIVLAQVMQRPGIDVFGLFIEVSLEVKRATAGRQQPWVSNSPMPMTPFAPAPPQQASLPPQGFDEAKLRALAQRQSIPLPARFGVAPAAGENAALDRYLGAWGGDDRWGGAGRHAIVVVTSVDAAGQATGIFAQGPPTPRSFEQNPARFWRIFGQIDAEGFRFTVGATKMTFVATTNGLMLGRFTRDDGRRSQITLGRIE